MVAECECKCGGLAIARVDFLKSGKVISCGCSRHGLSKTKLYYVWKDIKNRCYRESMENYKWYGKKGITMCDTWINDAVSFIEWCKSHGYKEGLQIDRIDNDKGYCPDNCRFVTCKENLRNTSANIHITYKGETHTLVEWCEKLDIPYSRTFDRIRKGLSVEKALFDPVCQRQTRKRYRGEDGRITGIKLDHKGLSMTIPEWAKYKGMSANTLYARIQDGWSVARALEEKVAFRKKRSHNGQ